MSNDLRVLVVEDSPADAKLIVAALRQGTHSISHERVDSADGMRAALANGHWDIITCDWAMPRFSATAALALLKKSGLDIPFVIVSGTVGEELAVDAMRAGAHDYVIKDRLARLAPAVERELRDATARAAQRQAAADRQTAEASLRISEAQLYERMKMAALTADVGIALAHKDTLPAMLQSCSEAVVKHLGAAFARVWTIDASGTLLELQASAGLYTHIDGAHARVPAGPSLIGAIVTERQPHLTNDVRLDSRISDPAWAVREGMTAFAGFPLIAGGDLVGVVAMFSRESLTDTAYEGLRAVADAIAVSIRRNRAESAQDALEAQLRQAQKLEAIGSLAGGIAHDFNNILSVILSYSEFIITDLGPGHPLIGDANEINDAAIRAASLTSQLLAFSRQQVLQPQILDLNEVVRDLKSMLRRVLSEDIELAIVADPTIGNVNADPGQIEQVLMNLVVNARDAIPGGGSVTIETANATLDAAFAAEHVGVTPGAYVMLRVTDSGKGMDADLCGRIFEPFFTTKEKGKGTGLGLSTVFGIIQQSGGTIWVTSEVGRGTTFTVYLPVVAANVGAQETSRASAIKRGTETILLCEDDERVRILVRAILTRNGYRVLEAQNGGEALMLCEQSGTIDLLLTDVVMPMMSGRRLAERLHVIRPDLKVLYMSGYTDDAIVRQGILKEEIAFLAKPITPDAVAQKVRDVLDAGKR